MISMAVMPLYMWQMWDVTPVTHERTVESRAVFSLSWIRKRNQNSCPSECLAVKNWCLGKTCVFQGHKGCGEGRSKLGWNSISSQVSHLLKMKWSVPKKYREPKILDKKHFHFQSKRWAQTQGRRSSQRLAPSATLWRLVASTNKVKTFLEFNPFLQQATRWIPPWLVVQPDNLCTYWLTFCNLWWLQLNIQREHRDI